MAVVTVACELVRIAHIASVNRERERAETRAYVRHEEVRVRGGIRG